LDYLFPRIHKYTSFRFLLILAHLAEGHESLWDGAASVRHSVVRLASTFFFKQLLLQNHLIDFNQIW